MRVAAAAIFTLGSALAAAVVYGLLGLLGSAFWPFTPVVSFVALGGALVWHLRGKERVPWGHEHVQARRDLAMHGPKGTLYFGAILGVGLLTDMATPLVYGGAALSLTLQVLPAIAYGVGFGLGRAGPAWIAVLVGRRFSPGSVAAQLIGATRFARWPGSAIAAIGLATSVLASGWVVDAN